MKTRSISFVLALMLSSTLLTTSAFADAGVQAPQIVRFDDGSYVVITIEQDQPLSGSADRSARSVKSGTKNYDYYGSANELVLTFRVHGTFEYNGTSASATGATYSYDIYDSGWSFVDGSAVCSGATATATGNFKWLMFPNSVSVSLTCSPNGVLS